MYKIILISLLSATSVFAGLNTPSILGGNGGTNGGGGGGTPTGAAGGSLTGTYPNPGVDATKLTGVVPLANGGLGNANGNAIGITNVPTSSLNSGTNYTSVINTNIIVATGFGTNPVNGVYGFSNNVSGISYYTNGIGFFIAFDIGGGPFGFIGTNGQSEGGSTFLYEADFFPNNVPNDAMYGVSSTALDGSGGWANSGFFTDIGPNPVGITVWGESYTPTATTQIYTNTEVYVSPGGNDHPSTTGPFALWLSLSNALLYAAINPGTTIHLQAGTYSYPNNPAMTIPDRTTVVGAGKDNTLILPQTNAANVVQARVTFGNQTTLRDLSIQASFYITGNSNFFYGVREFGIYDGLILYNNTWDNLYAENSTFSSGGDGLVSALPASGYSANVNHATFFNCDIAGDGSLTSNGQNVGGVCRGLNVSQGIFRIMGGRIRAVNNAVGSSSAARNACIEISGTNALVYVSGVGFQCTATNGQTNIVLYVAGAAPATNCVFEYDNCIPNLRTNDVFGGVVQMLGGVNATNVFGASSLITSQHFRGAGTSPTVFTNSAAGTTGSVSLDANASDTAGTVTLVTGTGAAGNGALFHVVYNTAFATVPHVICPGVNALAVSASDYYISTNLTTGFTLSVGASLTTGTLQFTYIAVQ